MRIAIGAVLLIFGVGVGTAIVAHRPADPELATRQDLQAGFREAGPIQRQFGYRQVELTAALMKCREQFADRGQPEVCAPAWMDADNLASQMRDAIAALPDQQRYDTLAERLRQVNIAGERYRGRACTLGFHPQSEGCAQMANALAVSWSGVGIDLQTLEPTR